MAIATASARNVNPVTLSTQIFEVTNELGKIEGIAQEKGFPGLPAAREVDCGALALQRFERERAGLALMREDLNRIYARIHSMGNDSSLIAMPEIRDLFERQIKALHEKRALLENSLRGFDSLLKAHLLLDEMLGNLRSIEGAVQSYERGELSIEDAAWIRDKVEDLLVQTRVVFPAKKRGAIDFCEVHFERNKEIGLYMHELRYKLNLSEIRRRAGLEEACKGNVEIVLKKLDGLAHISGQYARKRACEEIQTVFLALPLALRIEVFTRAGALPRDMAEKADALKRLSDKQVMREKLGELFGVVYYDQRRAKRQYKEEIRGLTEERKVELQEAVALLQQGLSHLPEFLLDEPKKVRSAIESALVRFPQYRPKGVTVPMEEVEIPASDDEPEVKPPSFEQVAKQYEASPAMALEDLKRQVVEVKALERFKPEERELLAGKVLDAAEKNGIALSCANGVYFWIWHIAHEKDSTAGGDNFGKSQAPKDLDRLLSAIDKAMPKPAAPVKKEAPLLSAAEMLQGISHLKLQSLEELKNQVAEVRKGDRFTTAERESLLNALLETVAKGGIALDKPQGVYYWIWSIAHEKDAKAGGDHFGKLHAPKDIGRLLLAIEKAMPKTAAPVKKEEPLPSAAELLRRIPLLKLSSLDDLRRQVVEVRKADRFTTAERESLLNALLETVAKGGIALDKPQGVYYWIWSIAHEKDAKAGGDHFGKLHAPKDVERLLQAIDKAKVH